VRDSLDIVEIVMAIEEALDLDLSDADAELPAKEILERIERENFRMAWRAMIFPPSSENSGRVIHAAKPVRP